MGEFFQGGRRKMGCVALVMACVLMAGWVRSRFISDRITIRRYGIVTEYLVSQESGLGWVKEVSWNLIGADVLTDVPYGEWLGFQYGMKLVPGNWKVNVRIIPYWSLTIPLTLLSAYLILWKPRPKPTATSPAGGGQHL